jgi:NMD protein affecting ribosome stability and mRNA decay
MVADNVCHECGAPLPENAPEGLCPKCLMRIAMAQSHK